MKKTVIIILIAVLTVTGIIGTTFALVGTSSNEDTTPTNPTVISTTASTASTEETTVETQPQTQAPTQAETQAPTTTSDSTTKPQTSNTDDTLKLPDLRGTWKNENYPNNYSVQVVKQNGNDMEILITAMRGNASQMATSRVNFTLETSDETGIVRGSAEFDYTDSFGNSGTGYISVSKNVIQLIIEEEEVANPDWGIRYATADYIFASNDINPNEYNF